MLPDLALSVRQPWAWAIIHGGKDIENRSWQAVNHGLKRRGRICIHASKGLSMYEYEDAQRFIEENDIACPLPRDLKFGQIIGTVDVVDVVSDHESPWFMGPRGLVLKDPEPIELPYLVHGQLGYFKWNKTDELPPPPKPWMESWPEPHPRRKQRSRTIDMFTRPNKDAG